GEGVEVGPELGPHAERLGEKTVDGIADAGSEEQDECDPHLACRDRPDHDRHQQDAAERNEVRNAQVCAPARPARLAVTIGRRTYGHARISIAAIKPLHSRGFPSTQAREQRKDAPWQRQASPMSRPASTSIPASAW